MRYLFIILVFFSCSCARDMPIPNSRVYKTKNVFIVVMDGARYTETWGKPGQPYIPNIKQLASQGVMCTNFFNYGQTLTTPGHTAMTTGFYESIDNSGQEIPTNPSIFQYYRSQFSKAATDAWVISSKDKLEVLSDCFYPSWAGRYRPSTDCGMNGLNTGYREDSITYRHLIDTITKYHPHMVIVNFKQPDVAGHANDWLGYVNETKQVDQYIGALWSFLQSDSLYAGTTTLFVTNDHGRHLDGHLDGFVSHGDGCEGCRHIFMLGIGPDFKVNHIEEAHYSLIDIPATIAGLMGINMPNAQGKGMTAILK